jgi:hypothetical protein
MNPGTMIESHQLQTDMVNTFAFSARSGYLKVHDLNLNQQRKTFINGGSSRKPQVIVHG